MLNVSEFKKIFPRCEDPSGWINAMEELFPKCGITTKKRVASFLAQCGHESGGWSIFIENLNYSAKALDIVFPKYFKNAGRDAEKYARQPEKIANIVYANRMGNGDTNSGDGWKFRGRGPIQLTGRDNYRNFGRDFMVNVEENPDLVSQDKKISLMAALWFWDKHNLNKFADDEDIKGMTRIINGGYNGLDDRLAKYKKIIETLNDTSSFVNISNFDDEKEDLKLEGVLRRGSRGENVKIVQKFLNLTPDGIFGLQTEIAVKNWQQQNGLYVDGIVGPKTLEKMMG